MGWKIQSNIGPLPMFEYVKNFYSYDEMDQISFLENLQSFQQGSIQGSQLRPNLQEYRDSSISWLYPDRNTEWLFQKFSSLTSEVNQRHFKYDLDGFDAFQYTMYEANQHYDWHMDFELQATKYVRKISSVIMVSDPEEYGGGEFEIVTGGNLNDTKKFKMDRGDILFFASWMPHRVLPVTHGKRKSLVSWVMGEYKG